MKTFYLFLLAVLLFTFVYIKSESQGDLNSQFNQTTRFQLGRYSLLRTVFGLHQPGDARGWFLKGAGPIDIEVVQAKGAGIDEAGLNNFAARVTKYTGRPAMIFHSDTVQGGTLSPADLATINNDDRHQAASGDTNLFVIYAQDFQNSGADAARPYQEAAVVVSDVNLRRLAQNSPQAVTQYTEALLLHEFGRQLGLPENTQDGCIMNRQIQAPQWLNLESGDLLQDFCPFELGQLQAIKSQF